MEFSDIKNENFVRILNRRTSGGVRHSFSRNVRIFNITVKHLTISKVCLHLPSGRAKKFYLRFIFLPTFVAVLRTQLKQCQTMHCRDGSLGASAFLYRRSLQTPLAFLSLLYTYICTIKEESSLTLGLNDF